MEQEAFAIAKNIAYVFFNKLSSNKKEAMDYYCENSQLCFNGNKICGKTDISSFWEKEESHSFQAKGFETQIIPGSNLWTMTSIIGTVLVNSDARPFHSSIYVCADTNKQKAFIVNQTISIY